MSLWGQNGQGSVGGDEPLDDATVEELLDGHYRGDAPDLVAVGRFLEQFRSLGDRPAPPPSRALAEILGPSVPAPRDDGAATARQSLRVLRIPAYTPISEGGKASAPRHDSSRLLLPALAAVAALLLVVVLAAGSARVLPGPTQGLVAKIVHALTPFDFPGQKRPEAVSSTARTPAAAPRPELDTRATTTAPSPVANTGTSVSPSHPNRAESRTNGSQPVGRGGTDTGSPGGDVKQAPVPTTTPAPAAEETPTPPQTTTLPSPGTVPPSRPSGPRFEADLRGTTGTTGGDSDANGRAIVHTNRGRKEVCLAVTVSGISPVTSAHVHAGSIGVDGPIVAAFPELISGAPARCVAVADDVIKKIQKEPGKYYVDVHTTESPNGAARGQLRR